MATRATVASTSHGSTDLATRLRETSEGRLKVVGALVVASAIGSPLLGQSLNEPAKLVAAVLETAKLVEGGAGR